MPSIAEISLERDCSGCATGSLLILRRDGTATLTLTGKARFGTENQVSTGTVRGQDFERLARLAVTQGFFRMKDEYQDPATADGAWVSTRFAGGGQDKRVYTRDGVGPAKLKAVEAAIDAVKARIRFAPERP